jgi:ankyrin repeat protein
MLLDAGANVNIADTYRETAVTYAEENENFDDIAVLITDAHPTNAVRREIARIMRERED